MPLVCCAIRIQTPAAVRPLSSSQWRQVRLLRPHFPASMICFEAIACPAAPGLCLKKGGGRCTPSGAVVSAPTRGTPNGVSNGIHDVSGLAASHQPPFHSSVALATPYPGLTWFAAQASTCCGQCSDLCTTVQRLGMCASTRRGARKKSVASNPQLHNVPLFGCGVGRDQEVKGDDCPGITEYPRQV